MVNSNEGEELKTHDKRFIFPRYDYFNLLIPVPLHKKRLKERGYNQSELLAKEISSALEIPLNCEVLEKVKYTLPQFNLNEKERMENIRGAFELKNIELIKGKKLLIIDDIFTTGITVHEVCRVLRKGKPESIYVLTLAR